MFKLEKVKKIEKGTVLWQWKC